jgi:hypothetical protein
VLHRRKFGMKGLSSLAALLFQLLISETAADSHHSGHNHLLQWTAAVPTIRRQWNLKEAIDSGLYRRGTGGLSEKDREILGKYYSSSKSIFEFGVGDSTNIAAYVNIPRYTGVDSDNEYLKMVAASTPPHFRYYFADVGQTGIWGFPLNASSASKYPFYSIGALASEGQAFDFYFVDGRFRLSCVCAALLHASNHGKKPNEFLVAVHDYRLRHDSNYAMLKQIAVYVDGFDSVTNPTVQESEDDLNIFVFRRREDVDDATLARMWRETNTNPL